MNTFENLKKLIGMGTKADEEILIMMDVFLMNNRINAEQYNELTELITE